MKEAFGFTKRLIRRDFSGYTGLAVKNSIYSFLTGVVGKVGSLLFTALLVGSSLLVKILSLFSIEIRPLLSPELFGLYSLALSTILLFGSFTDLGIGNALVRYISKFGKKSKGHINYLFKIKIILTSCVALFLIAISVFIEQFYQKPIGLAIVAGAAYITGVSLLGMFSGFFQAENNFRITFYRELVFQTLRLIIVPISIFYIMARSDSFTLFIIFISLAICYFLALLFLKLNLGQYSGKKLNKKQKKEVNKFIVPLGALALSGTFFGYIDIIMLGRFVESQFIAYYQAAFALVGSGLTILSFSAVLFPIFSRLKGSRLKNGFKKAIIVTIPIALLGFLAVLVLAPIAVKLIYNSDYIPTILILQFFSILFLIDPFINIYYSYYLSLGKSLFIAKILIISTVVNVILNFFLIKYLIVYGSYYGVFGAVIATILSRVVYIGLLVLKKK